ncbi:MAG: hypothetical protein ABI763_04195 [Bacteroidota bacterium]
MTKLFPIRIAMLASATMLLWLQSCEKPETINVLAPPGSGHGLVTTIKLTCINKVAPYDTISGTWRDLTPDDTNPPDTSLAVLILKKNTVYKVSIEILDETRIPPREIGEAIIVGANYNIFCFYTSASLGINLAITRTDLDTNNPPLPIGFKDNFITTNPSNGLLEIVLRHQPNCKNGSCETGSVDLDVGFSVSISK